ncbi:MAG: sugar ABC transporter substrate-binding protein [Christensenellaceae bacterium]
MIKKIAFVLSVVLSVCCFSTSCFNQQKSAPKTGITIKCALIGYGDYEKLYESIPIFEDQTGIDVEIVYLDNHFELDKKLKRDFSSDTDDYDVISNHSSFYSQYIDYLEPLNQYFSQEELTDFLPRLLNSGKQNGNLYLMPRHADISSILYRTDLFKDENYKKQFFDTYHRELSVPQTWDEFEQVATFFGQFEGLYGTQFAGKEEALTGRFYEVLLANGGHFIDNTGNAVFNSPQGIKSAMMFKNLYQNGSVPEDTFDYLWDDLAKNFASGNVAIYVEWYSYYSFLQDPKRSQVVGKFDIARLPIGDGGIHSGWMGMHGFSITKNSNHKEQSAELIRFLTNKDSSYAEAKIGYLPVRSSVWNRVISDARFDDMQQKRLELAKLQLSEDSFTPPLTPEWISASDIFYPIFQQIISGEQDIKTGLDDAAHQINAMLQRNTYF